MVLVGIVIRHKLLSVKLGLGDLLLSLEHFEMQRCQQVFGPLEYDLEGLGVELARHAMGPDADDDHDVFDAHLLQKV